MKTYHTMDAAEKAEFDFNLAMRTLKTELATMRRERDTALSAIRVVLFDPETRDYLRDADPQALVQLADAHPVHCSPVDAPSVAAIREVSRIVQIIKNNPVSKRVF